MERLVDANALIKKSITIPVNEDDGYLDHIEVVRVEDIENAPTIDPESLRPHGDWILERDSDGNPYCFHCSVCDRDFHYIGIKVAYDYCPHCTAKMDGVVL